MRTSLLAALGLAVLGLAAPAHADVWLVGKEPPPPPEPARPYVRPLLGDRWTVTAQTGVGWIGIDGVHNSGGLMIDPTVTRTFDRLELSADYLAMDWHDPTGMRSSGTVHRVGGEIRYQAGRVRIEQTMSLDAVLSAGLGWQHVVQDHGASIDRPDVSLGLVLRTITDMDRRDPQRVFFGMEIGGRFLASRDGDKSFLIAFGVPFGW